MVSGCFTLIRRATFAALLSTFAAAAQGPVKDVEGWREAKWGMTKAQVLQAFPSEAKQEPPIKTKHGFIEGAVTITNLRANSKEMEASFDFGNGGLLDRIVLKPKGAAAMLFSEWYKAMLPLLIEKYGQPTVRNEPRQRSESAVWSFPSTTIEIVTYGELFTTRIEYRQGGSKNNPL